MFIGVVLGAAQIPKKIKTESKENLSRSISGPPWPPIWNHGDKFFQAGPPDFLTQGSTRIAAGTLEIRCRMDLANSKPEKMGFSS